MKPLLTRLTALVFALCLLCSAACADTVTMTFSFTGDVTLGCDWTWWEDESAFPNVAVPKGYEYPFAKVQHLFTADDLTIVNLEGVLQNDDTDRRGQRRYNFRGLTDYTGFLTHGSVEAVTLGNNHAMDFGRTGLASTKAALDAAGIGWMRDDDVFFYEKDGIKVAFLGYLQDAFFKRMDDLDKIVRELKEEQGCAAVILNLHIGNEYSPTHVSTQRNSAAAAVRDGVDLVIMHHPHVLQGVDVMGSRTILYSLGNFCFGGDRLINAEELPTLVAVAQLTFEDGVYTGQQVTLHPMHCTGEPGNNYQPCPVTGAEAENVMTFVQADTDFDLPPYVEGQGVVLPYLPAEAAE